MKKSKTLFSTFKNKTYDENEYSEPDSETDESRLDIKTLSPIEREEHLKELWRLCFLKSYGGSQIRKVFSKMH
jgi:hypothetical protein